MKKEIFILIITGLLILVAIAQFVFGVNYHSFALNYYNFHWYQIFTNSFFHENFIHFVGNFFIWCVAAALLYYYKEDYSTKESIMILLLTQLFVGIGFILFTKHAYSVGFSSIDFAFLGFLFMISLKRQFKTHSKENLGLLIGIASLIIIFFAAIPVLSNFKGGTDYLSHLIGIIVGLSFGALNLANYFIIPLKNS